MNFCQHPIVYIAMNENYSNIIIIIAYGYNYSYIQSGCVSRGSMCICMCVYYNMYIHVVFSVYIGAVCKCVYIMHTYIHVCR